MLIFVIIVFTADQHCVKRVRIRSYTGPHFPAFSCIRTAYGEIQSISPYSVQMWENPGKMRTRITPNTDTFYAVQTISKKPMYKKSL